jgi:hypothetical protein
VASPAVPQPEPVAAEALVAPLELLAVVGGLERVGVEPSYHKRKQ